MCCAGTVKYREDEDFWLDLPRSVFIRNFHIPRLVSSQDLLLITDFSNSQVGIRALF